MAQQTPNRFSLDLDHDLDRSAQQQQDDDSGGFRRDSSIGRFDFEDNYHQGHHFNQVGNSNTMMRDSQCSEDGGVFSYNDDYRMRQSARSDEECELQDIGGNADMSDRKVQIKSDKIQNNSKQEDQSNQFEQIKIIEKYQASQKTNDANEEKDGGSKIEGENYVQIETQQHTLEPITTQVQQQLIQQQQQQSVNQSLLPKTYEPLQKTQQLANESLTKSEPSTTTTLNVQPISNKQHFPIQQRTPQKQHILTTSQDQHTVDPSYQWSNQSNRSSSPIIDLDMYNKPSNNEIDSIQIKKQQKVSQPAKKQQPYQKPKITFVKQSIIVEEKKSSSSSIKDWFRSSAIPSKTNDQKPQKQYNPNTNQIPSPVKQINHKDNYRKQLQAQMQGFQQSFNNYRKQTTSKPSAQTAKQREKANKTHLMIGKNTLNNNIPEPASEDLRMLLKICVQKKKQNYSMLREWDKKRAQTMNLHRNMVEMLQNQIDKRIKSSLQNFEIYSNFFKEKLKQQEKFTTSPVINTKYALQNNSISKNIYINCSVILNSLSQENQLKCKKVQDFITLLKNDVLKDLIEAHMQDSQRQLLKVREKISTLKNSLKKYNQETEEKSQELARLFNQSGLTVRPVGDFYSSQLEFLRSASQQVFIQKRLGENCLEYYHTAVNEEFKRAKVIRQALLTYSKGLKQTYNIQLEQVGLEQLSKTQEIKLIEEFYSLQEMFDQRTGQMLKEKYSIPSDQDITIAQVTKFIETQFINLSQHRFQYEQFNNRMLLLKEFSAKYYSAVNKQFKTPREQSCHIVITVDFYLHMFFSPDKSSLKPDISLKITPKQLQIKPQKQQFVDIIKKEEKRPSMISYFWESKNQRVYRVKFPSKDNKELFYDYLNKLLS